MLETIIHGDAMKQTLEKFLQLAQPTNIDSNAAYGGMGALEQINASATKMRSSRPGGLPQQEALPGSVEQQAMIANQQQPMKQTAVGFPSRAPM